MTSGSSHRNVRPGSSWPLGAIWDGKGVNFALFSANAEKVELCLFDDQGRKEIERFELLEYTNEVWHCYIPELYPGTVYGYRVYGSYDPERGHRFNHHKLLIDPYARELRGKLIWHKANFAYRYDSPRGDLSFDKRDNARYVPKSVVIDPSYYWVDDASPDVSWHNTIIYELHVKGMTALHPDVPLNLRGTFAGLATPEVIEHIKGLGVNAVELLPIFPCSEERHMEQYGLTNYWGYNSYNFFAADPRFLAGAHANEFRTMVRHYHDAGIQVILDVVYNHTGEGSHLGPSLSFRGIDNASYYRLRPGDERNHIDRTGCGNTLNMAHPRVIQMIMDSMRYWANEMHVDGFRFDLASTLADDGYGFDTNSTFLKTVRQEPSFHNLKLIAEPWDLASDGYQLGRFPPGWSEWNDKYRDTVRAFWNGRGGIIGELASCLTGSSNRFEHGGRRPRSSINFVTAHDGFTLEDLVSYEKKHNEANLEDNRDGTDNNLSFNYGFEGPTNAPEVLINRFTQKRNIMTTLLLSQGVPMIVAGDELGRTQQGNNNAYCQDNEISWIDWNLIRQEDIEFLDFIKKLIKIRKKHPVFHRSKFFHGEFLGNSAIKDITWLSPEGRELTSDEWHLTFARCFGFHLGGAIGEPCSGGDHKRVDARFVVLMNADKNQIGFTLPSREHGRSWDLLLDTSRTDLIPHEISFRSKQIFPLRAFSLVVLIHSGDRFVTSKLDADDRQQSLAFDNSHMDRRE